MRIREKITSVALGLVSAAAIGAFGWVWRLNVEVALLHSELSHLKESQRDLEQDKRIHLCLKYSGWLHRRLGELQRKAGVEESWLPENFWD